MSSRRRTAFWAAVIAAAWTVEGVTWTLQWRANARMDGRPYDMQIALVQSLFSSFQYALITGMVIWLTVRWPLARTQPTHLVPHLAGFALVAVGRPLLAVVLDDSIRMFDFYDPVPPWATLVEMGVENNLITYSLLTLAVHAVYYGRRHQQQQELLARAELHMLRAQVRPHFLFNALNVIASNVHDRPQVADDMIVRLGVLLRRSLMYDGAIAVPLPDELDLARAYLDIEQARFEAWLSVEWAVDERTLDAEVPTLLLQPLVENAVRHGLWPRAAPGTVWISARRDADKLVLTVEDDGIGPPDHVVDGVGLSTTRSRLERLYGEAQSFRLDPRPGGGTVAAATLPYRVATERGLDHANAHR